MIISIYEEKAFGNVQHPFIIKTLSKVGIEGVVLNIIKSIYERPTAVSYTHLTLPTMPVRCRSRWSPYH